MQKVEGKRKAYMKTAGELASLGAKGIPDEFVPACHLIYSSPATLAYNSPGAIGFGVKRAALVLPESVMLLVAPGCCGRNSTILSENEGYADRMFYLEMDETDIVTGRHLKAIPEAINEIMEVATPKPKAVVICITCVDALLATDLESICENAQSKCKVLVVPSYMYALTREGRKPPMTAIRQTLYSLLEKKEKRPDMVNILGFFSAMDPKNDLFSLLHEAGVKTINQIAEMKNLEEYYEMGGANFNIVLDKESLPAAEDLKKRLGMPYIELARLYSADRIHRQYQLFASAIGVDFKDQELYENAKEEEALFGERFKGTTFVTGEMMNGNPFEVAADLAELGLLPKSIFSNVTAYDIPFIKRLASLYPEVPVYTGISPSMINYENDVRAELAIGKDGALYCPAAAPVEWNQELQPFGYTGLSGLLSKIREVLS